MAQMPNKIGQSQDWVACPSCDQLFDISKLVDGQQARCSRCHHLLTVYRSDSFCRVQAFSLTALICLIIACSFPFLSFKVSGVESVMTLPETAVQLYNQGQPYLSALVAGFILLIPAVLVTLTLALSMALTFGANLGWLKSAGLLVFHLQSWSMVEVFFIGVLVSLVKISAMATVVVGVAFWGYAAFSIFFILSMSRLDRVQCWHRIEELTA